MTVAGATFSSIYQNRLPESWYQVAPLLAAGGQQPTGTSGSPAASPVPFDDY
jgi:hypothetical protein